MVYSVDSLEHYPPVLQGGVAKTRYDEGERPTETKIYDAEGLLVQRVVQSYNATGKIAETSVVIDGIAGLLPSDLKARLMTEPGAAEEMQRQLGELLGAGHEMFKRIYIYDGAGLLSESRDYLGANQETVTKFVYDGNGNKVTEFARTTGEVNRVRTESGGAEPGALAQESEVTYTYKYDDHGNWIEQITRSRPGPSEPFSSPTVCRRTITYF